MTLRDLLDISIGNLWRMKLRAGLTVAGVVIAIAAFVSMLSFGAGNQQYVTDQFNKLGLFATMQVSPLREKSVTDTVKIRQLNDSAIAELAAIPGVRLAYPFDAFNVTVQVGDSVFKTSAQALPESAAQTKLYSHLVAGHSFSSDSASEALATEGLVEMAGFKSADSLVGKQVIVSVKVASLDSALLSVVRYSADSLRQQIRGIQFDSLFRPEYLRNLARRQVSGAINRFVEGYFNDQATVSDTLTVTGVLFGRHGEFSRMKPLLIPLTTARRFNYSGTSTDPADLLSSLQSGTLFASENDNNSRIYPRVTLDLDPTVPYSTISDSVKALGFSTFSYLEQFKEIQQFFLYFNLALGLIGLIALTTASLGIVNTMVMSIIERTREIGVLKSLGADEFDIRLLFLVESGVIGAIGSVVGILFGWGIARVASAIAKMIMARQGITPIELFRLPIWLILVAFSFGFIVSILAGYYPASRAAGVDPVKALRNE